jgi:hypothetical protein
MMSAIFDAIGRTPDVLEMWKNYKIDPSRHLAATRRCNAVRSGRSYPNLWAYHVQRSRKNPV